RRCVLQAGALGRAAPAADRGRPLAQGHRRQRTKRVSVEFPGPLCEPVRCRMDEGSTRVRVMGVEDDPEVAKAIARKLGGDGLEVERADDPRPVLARLDAGEGDGWDVVLLDVGLPGMSGIEVLKRFREANSLASIVMLTGDNSANTATTCMRAGAFYYLTKPFRPYELSSMVESAARYATLRRELQGTRQVIDDA